MIIASLTSCQAKRLIFTIFLWGKFLSSPHAMKFSILLHSLTLPQWFSSYFLSRHQESFSLPGGSQWMAAWVKPPNAAPSPSCLHFSPAPLQVPRLPFRSGGRMFSPPVRGKLLRMCPGVQPVPFRWLSSYVILFSFSHVILLYN